MKPVPLRTKEGAHHLRKLVQVWAQAGESGIAELADVAGDRHLTEALEVIGERVKRSACAIKRELRTAPLLNCAMVSIR